MKGVINFIGEVKLELSKVVWPKKEEVVKLTMIVIIFSAIVAIYLGFLDFSFTKILQVLTQI